MAIHWRLFKLSLSCVCFNLLKKKYNFGIVLSVDTNFGDHEVTYGWHTLNMTWQTNANGCIHRAMINVKISRTGIYNTCSWSLYARRCLCKVPLRSAHQLRRRLGIYRHIYILKATIIILRRCKNLGCGSSSTFSPAYWDPGSRLQ